MTATEATAETAEAVEAVEAEEVAEEVGTVSAEGEVAKKRTFFGRRSGQKAHLFFSATLLDL